MLWHTPILRTIPISGGASSQMGKKQAMRAAVKAEVTATPRATLQCWLNIPSHSLVRRSSPRAQNLLHQLYSTSGTVTPTILFSVSLLLSLLFLFVFSNWLLHHQGTTCLLSNYHLHFTNTFNCFSPALSFFWSREYSVCWGELCTFSALGTGVINMIYLPNVPVISLLWIGPDLDNWLVLMCTEEK